MSEYTPESETDQERLFLIRMAMDDFAARARKEQGEGEATRILLKKGYTHVWIGWWLDGKLLEDALEHHKTERNKP